MKVVLTLLLAALAAGCASTGTTSVADSPLLSSSVAEDSPEPASSSNGLFSKLEGVLSDHWRDCMRGLSVTTNALSRRTAEDRTRLADALK